MKVVAALIALQLGSCTTTSSKKSTTHDVVSLKFPQKFKAVHQLTLEINDKEYELTGYLLFKHPNSYWAAAYGEAGGSVFKFKMIEGTFASIHNPLPIPTDTLKRSIGNDLITIFGGNISTSKTIAMTKLIRNPNKDQRHPKSFTYRNTEFHYKLTVDLVSLSNELPSDFDKTLKEQ